MMGDLFESLGIELDDQCYVFPNGRQFCTDEEYSLKFYINGEAVESITDYVDRIIGRASPTMSWTTRTES